MVLQRLDVADHRGERRAELVAGVGDEVRAQLLGAAGLGAVLDLHDGLRLRAEAAVGRQQPDPGLEEALAALVGGELRTPRSSPSAERRAPTASTKAGARMRLAKCAPGWSRGSAACAAGLA